MNWRITPPIELSSEDVAKIFEATSSEDMSCRLKKVALKNISYDILHQHLLANDIYRQTINAGKIDVVEDIISKGLGVIISNMIRVNSDNIIFVDTYLSKGGKIPYISDPEYAIENYSKNNGEFSAVDADGFALLQMMDTLRINPSQLDVELRKIFKSRYFQGDFPDIHYDASPVLPVTVFAELLDSSTYGGSLLFSSSIRLGDYINDIQSFKDKGITIGENSCVTIHEWIHGSCGLTDIKTKESLTIKEYRVMPADNHAYGYGLDAVVGLTHDYWEGTRICPPAPYLENESSLDMF